MGRRLKRNRFLTFLILKNFKIGLTDLRLCFAFVEFYNLFGANKYLKYLRKNERKLHFFPNVAKRFESDAIGLIE